MEGVLKEKLYSDWPGDKEKVYPVRDLKYTEGIFVGYRWHEKKNIEPPYPFGHGLSYTSFANAYILKESAYA